MRARLMRMRGRWSRQYGAPGFEGASFLSGLDLFECDAKDALGWLGATCSVRFVAVEDFAFVDRGVGGVFDANELLTAQVREFPDPA